MYINRHGRDSEMYRTSGINALMTFLALRAKSRNILMQFKPNKELCYRDAPCQSKSRQLLHNCTNTLYNKSTTNKLKYGVTELYQKSARFVQSFRYNTCLWQTDRRTDGRTNRKTTIANTALQHSIGSRGKNLYFSVFWCTQESKGKLLRGISWWLYIKLKYNLHCVDATL